MPTNAKLHPRNQHGDGYDFARLVKQSSMIRRNKIINELSKFEIISQATHLYIIDFKSI